jgi:SAM-dependent methyltransferase
VKVDLGCGPRKREGYLGVDIKEFPGVDVVADLRERWPWPDGSVDEVRCSHFLEHLTGAERVHFANELYRVLKPGGTATILTPHWSHRAAYGDVTHQWPPVSEQWYSHLSRRWREVNASHDDRYTCDFNTELSFNLDADIPKAEDMRVPAWHFRDVVFELVATLKKIAPASGDTSDRG